MKTIEALVVEGGHGDRIGQRWQSRWFRWRVPGIAARGGVPITVVSRARSYGEHNADAYTGYRHCRWRSCGQPYDDDGQNPPAEALRLWRARA